MAIPVHIVSGFLGAGKTTAIRAQLEARRGEQIAVIVNDFGEAALDEVALSEAEPFRITNIPGGCVCCTAPEGFVAALGAVLEGEPDRLIIEPTGLARPQDLVDTIRRSPHRERLELGPVLVIVDPRRVAGAEGEARELLLAQVDAADVLVANRTDLCSAAELEAFDAWAGSLWPPPLLLRHALHGQLSPADFEWPESEGSRLPRALSPAPGGAGHPHSHSSQGHSTAGFAARSWRWAPDLIFSSERLRSTLTQLAKGQGGPPLERFKGIFRTREGVFRYDVAGGELHEATSGHRRDSRADAVFTADASGGLDDAAGRLEAAVLSPEEIEASGTQIEVALPGGRAHVLDREQLDELPDGVGDVSSLFPKRAGSAARVGRLLESLGVTSKGTAVVVAADGFASEPVPLAALAQGLLLHSLDGEPLPQKQGGPFRLLIPDDVPDAPPSCANVKAVTRVVIRE